jgi:hypothetical protein
VKDVQPLFSGGQKSGGKSGTSGPEGVDPTATHVVRSGMDEPFVMGVECAGKQIVRGPLRSCASGGHLQAGGVSPLSFGYFSLRPAKKSDCRPAQGQH